MMYLGIKMDHTTIQTPVRNEKQIVCLLSENINNFILFCCTISRYEKKKTHRFVKLATSQKR